MSKHIIKHLTKSELHDALSLVWEVFCEYEAVNYPESGKEAFRKAIYSEEYLKTLTVHGAFQKEKLIGIIATRNEGRHIALFFVDGRFQGQGVGRALWDAVRPESPTDSSTGEVTVHSSLYAAEIYKKLGFVQTGDVKEEDGIRYVPMMYKAAGEMSKESAQN